MCQLCVLHWEEILARILPLCRLWNLRVCYYSTQKSKGRFCVLRSVFASYPNTVNFMRLKFFLDSLGHNRKKYNRYFSSHIDRIIRYIHIAQNNFKYPIKEIEAFKLSQRFNVKHTRKHWFNRSILQYINLFRALTVYKAEYKCVVHCFESCKTLLYHPTTRYVHQCTTTTICVPLINVLSFHFGRRYTR